MQWNKTLEEIKIYEAGKPIELVVREFGINPADVVKLASNENPNGCSLKVTEAIAKNTHKASLYPDDSFYELKDLLAKKWQVNDNNIIIGCGSDQVLEFVSRALLDETSCVLMSKVTFAMYEVYAKQMGAKIIRTPSYQHKPDEFIEAYQKYKPKIVYICTPNNPTGDGIKKVDVLKIINAVDKETMVVVDGAYMEYAGAKDEAYKITPNDILSYENVIYLGTFSKAYGLGGMRVGYGIANEQIISQLLKMRPPFNITTLSLISAIEALKDEEFVQNSISTHFSELKRYKEFADKNGLKYIESYTNFITYLFDKHDSTKINDELFKNGVIVRNLASYGMNAIRITVGTDKQNSRLFEMLERLL
ncbi:MAG: histidinol-phosphate transaminase [Epsilonproteobacteria bacterium]|nr:histidinol-phosphate transaminase [Campylobacterota bacterium]